MRIYLTLLLMVSLSAAGSFGAEEPNAAAAPTSTPTPPPSAPPKLAANELEKLVMPIALHPDPLISIILPASVYPLEIVQAARFVKDTNNIPKVDEHWRPIPLSCPGHENRCEKDPGAPPSISRTYGRQTISGTAPMLLH